MPVHRPSDAQEAAQVVAWAAAEGEPLDIQGGGSKRALGRPADAAHRLDLSALSGIIDYDPAELVLTAQAATPMAEIEEQLSKHRQMLAWEPPDVRAVLSADAHAEPTLGGTLACNLSGPRRVRTGAARDHFLGFAAINGWGDAWKAGGKVVKNVTGYDLCKLQAGAFGTLSVMIEVTVRVLPRPETAATVLLRGLSDDEAVASMAAALNSTHEVSAAAHLSAAVAKRVGLSEFDGPTTALRIEGPRPSVAFRADAVATLLNEAHRLGAADTTRFWDAVAAARPFAGQPGALWRVCTAPTAAPGLVRQIQAVLPGAEAFYDWAGGLVWLLVSEDDDCGASAVRAAVAERGGHATLFRAPPAVRASVPVFEPLAPPLLALSRRVKAGFDPKGILNPGRMMEGV